MEPKEFDFEFPRGDTCPYSFELTDAQNQQLDINTNTAEITMTVRDGKNIVFQKKYSKGEIVVDGIDVNLTIKHTDTKDLKMNSKYNYDIQFNSGDYYKTLIIGIITLTREETH
jgi:hypothetical protein